MKRVFFLASIFILALLSFETFGQQKEKKRETILDEVVHIEKEVILDIPDVPRWCDRLELKKSRVNVGDCELYVEEEGDGIPIVLLHGGPGGTHHSFHPHFSRTRKFARIIYYDQRGCGLSDFIRGDGYTVDQAVEDLESLRKAMNIDEWIVLGWSYGGLLGQCYTIKYPESVMGLILMTAEPALRGQLESTRQYDYLTQVERDKINEFRVKYFGEQVSMEQLIYNAHLNGDWKRQNYYRPTMEEFACGALYEWQHDEDFNTVMSQNAGSIDLSGAFENCPIPTLIIEAKFDLTWNTDKPDKIHKNHPGSELVIFEESGHSPFKDEPNRYFTVLREFVAQVSEAPDDDVASWKDDLVEWKK